MGEVIIKNPFALLLSNTVTGSASLFQNNDIDLILPFPFNFGKSFHDHCIALNYSVQNNLTYIDDILQDYVQYEQNVTGFTKFKHDGLVQSILSILSLKKYRLKEIMKPNNKLNRKVFKEYFELYYHAYLMRKFYALNLHLRHQVNNYNYILNNKKLKLKILQFSFSKNNNIYMNNLEIGIYNALAFMKSIKNHV